MNDIKSRWLLKQYDYFLTKVILLKWLFLFVCRTKTHCFMLAVCSLLLIEEYVISVLDSVGGGSCSDPFCWCCYLLLGYITFSEVSRVSHTNKKIWYSIVQVIDQIHSSKAQICQPVLLSLPSPRTIVKTIKILKTYLKICITNELFSFILNLVWNLLKEASI